jgi:hypothetical protein
VNLVVRNPPRTDRALVEGFAEFGVSTVMRDALAAKGLTYVDAAK